MGGRNTQANTEKRTNCIRSGRHPTPKSSASCWCFGWKSAE
ncbi:unnamed protein product [Amoebophrya sp. A25]|nr:unnamed protein product [Amoebophrya sp. A25]|eukprot:GSA25T00006153001.1